MEYNGYLAIELDMPEWKDFVNAAIDKNDIYHADGEPKHNASQQGIEETPHCTILYGLENSLTANDIKQKTFPISMFQAIQFTGISIFKNEHFDVIKFDVASPQLNRLNAIMKKSFDYKNDYPVYISHCTIAYVKKGTGEKYVHQFTDDNKFAFPSRYYHKSPSQVKEYWN